MTKTQMKVALAVLGVGLVASVTSASAGYRGHHYYNSYPDSYVYSGNGSNYSNRYVYQSNQSDEIRELRRAFPSTNWPPSDRY